MALVDVIWRVPLAMLLLSKLGTLKSLTVCQVVFKLDFTSMRMERVKNVRYIR